MHVFLHSFMIDFHLHIIIVMTIFALNVLWPVYVTLNAMTYELDMRIDTDLPL